MINLKEYAIALKLTAHDCRLKKTGTCSLDDIYTTTDEEDENIEKSEAQNEYAIRYRYCRRLARLAYTDKFPYNEDGGDEMTLSLCSCGHLSCNGQHRACILSRTTGLADISYYKTDEKCSFCKEKYGPNEYQLLYDGIFFDSIEQLKKYQLTHHAPKGQ